MSGRVDTRCNKFPPPRNIPTLKEGEHLFSRSSGKVPGLAWSKDMAITEPGTMPWPGLASGSGPGARETTWPEGMKGEVFQTEELGFVCVFLPKKGTWTLSKHAVREAKGGEVRPQKLNRRSENQREQRPAQCLVAMLWRDGKT